jgi:hypothetical protein
VPVSTPTTFLALATNRKFRWSAFEGSETTFVSAMFEDFDRLSVEETVSD